MGIRMATATTLISYRVFRWSVKKWSIVGSYWPTVIPLPVTPIAVSLNPNILIIYYRITYYCFSVCGTNQHHNYYKRFHFISL